MRPQFERRARRAAAALGALALGVGISGTVATAAGSRAHPRIGHRKQRPRSLRLRALLLHPNVLVGHDVALIGVLRPGIGNRSIAVQERRGTRWVAVAHATTNPHGYFLERFWPRRLGRYTLRLHVAGLTAAHTTLVGRVATVYHQVVASWYGGVGMTACGQALGAGTLGVANKTLPCGTMVSLHYGARTVRVPVIDRGPYVPGRDYDLTYATKQALGAGDVSQIWASA
jgi:rare lipoprotein A